MECHLVVGSLDPSNWTSMYAVFSSDSRWLFQITSSWVLIAAELLQADMASSASLHPKTQKGESPARASAMKAPDILENHSGSWV